MGFGANCHRIRKLRSSGTRTVTSLGRSERTPCGGRRAVGAGRLQSGFVAAAAAGNSLSLGKRAARRPRGGEAHGGSGGSLRLTSNKAIKDWTEVLAGDEVITAAILDRLLHASHVLNLRGGVWGCLAGARRGGCPARRPNW
ncbi:MAG: ATP-binding protein [Rhodanobacteraceae bacterium]